MDLPPALNDIIPAKLISIFPKAGEAAVLPQLQVWQNFDSPICPS